MINLLIGPPGGGKSYEAVVYHVLPALTKGRKVITNLPLDIERLRAIDPAFPDLIQFVENSIGFLRRENEAPAGMVGRLGLRYQVEQQGEGVIRAFSTMKDFGDPWRQDKTGSGPLYVIDECHLCFPRIGTLISVEEWFSLHRHESADVLLITQSYGKVSKSIIDLVQVCYRVKKATAFGSAKKYIRKVQDGVRGDVVNTSVRTYEKRYFGLYKSHTRGGGEELAAEDITPIWKRWPFIGAGIMLPLAAVIFFSTGSPNPLKPKAAQASTKPATPPPSQAASHTAPEPTQSPAKAKETEPEGHPYAGRTLHVAGVMHARGDRFYVVAVAQNGQHVSDVTSGELRTLGYKVEGVTDCAVKVSYEKWSKWLICDAPTVGVIPQGGEPAARRSEPPEKAPQGVVMQFSEPGRKDS